jgi:hypothetical protein
MLSSEIRSKLIIKLSTLKVGRRTSRVSGPAEKFTTFSRCVNWDTVLDNIKSDNAVPVEGSAMTESAKRRVTADVIILAAGAATLVVLAYVGAL